MTDHMRKALEWEERAACAALFAAVHHGRDSEEYRIADRRWRIANNEVCALAEQAAHDG